MPLFSEKLRCLGLKATPKRLAMLEILAREGTYMSPDDVWCRMKGRFSKIGLPTVYRNLDELARGGMISTIFHPNRQLYYFLCSNTEHHHHFVCISCRKVDDIHFCALSELEREATRGIRGKVLSHMFQVSGVCAACLASKQGLSQEAAV